MGAKHKDTVMRVLNAALKSVDPYATTLKALREEITDPSEYNNIYVLGAGKAGAAMLHAVYDALGERISGGVVTVKDSHAAPASEHPRVELLEAGHPVPDVRGTEAARKLLNKASEATGQDLVICILSGGGSALLAAPAEGISLDDLQKTTKLLLANAATINELNAVRKHLSALSGGQLARRAYPARVLSLILSDVTGSPLDVIASGPTAPDPTTYADALKVLKQRGVEGEVPEAVLRHLRAGANGDLPETPKRGDPLFETVSNRIIAGNVIAVEAAERQAREMGMNTQIVSTFVEGEARDVGVVLAGIAREVARYGRPVKPPACLLFGGETTVTVRGSGAGGRNSELALSAAIALRGLGPDLVVTSFATDGGDGASPGAGAVADGTTIDRGIEVGLTAADFLLRNDSYTYWEQLGDAIMTGPTGTNVNDIMAVFAF